MNLTSASLANSQLEAGINQLERDAGKGYYNTPCIRALGRAAKALSHPEIADRALLLLRAVPSEAFWAGTITNIPHPVNIPEGMRTVELPEQWEDHPPYQQEKMIEYIRACAATEEHFALCLEGRFQEARARAGKGIRLEALGATLAILGEFDVARSIAADSTLETFRQQGIRTVLVIELFRYRRVGEAAALLAELETAGLDAWDRVHLALGFAGRVPWDIYPYSDW